MPEPNFDQAAWIQEGKTKAPELRASAQDAAKDMFAAGDISEFLDILSRLNNYDAYNLMLILQQYPKAKFLAGYNIWKRLIGNPALKILKPEWVGKGIDLVIPFTEAQNYSTPKLIWFATRQFDISQTYVKYELPQSVYVIDEIHSDLLVKSLCETISTEYHRTVCHKGADAVMKAAGLPGKLSETTVTIRDDMNSFGKLDWLIDCLCILQGSEENFPEEYKELFCQCIKYTFWKTWSLEPVPSLYSYKKAIQAVKEELQMEFLDNIRRTFRSLEESVAKAYSSLRKEQKAGNELKQLNEEIWKTDFKPPG